MEDFAFTIIIFNVFSYFVGCIIRVSEICHLLYILSLCWILEIVIKVAIQCGSILSLRMYACKILSRI